MDKPANSVFSGPLDLLSLLCVWKKSFSRAKRKKKKKKKKTKKDLRVSDFALLSVVSKRHHGSEGVKKKKIQKKTPLATHMILLQLLIVLGLLVDRLHRGMSDLFH